MRHMVVILHGIEADPSDTLWSEELAWRAGPYVQGRLEFHARKYGYVSGGALWWNWGNLSSGKGQRQIVVEHEAVYFDTLRENVGPDTLISVMCHSLGGYVIHQLLNRGFKFHRIIELYGAGDENQDWSLIEDNFDKIFIWWSPKDEILPDSNFGQIGLVGPQKQHPKVTAIETTDTHTDFMDHLDDSLIPIWLRELEG